MTCDTISNDMTMAGGVEGTLLANRYRIVKQLGQGGMGSVWLAEDTQLDNKPFAIKMLPSILVSNKRAYRQLKDEALVAMKLSHPNIVTLRAFEENNGNPFLVMDYIEGETLDDYLAEHCGDVLTQSRRDAEEHGAGAPQPVGSRVPRDRDGRARSPSAPQGGLPESDVLRILRPIAAALDYAHSKGVVHRDVKPGNVMIAKDGTPYILDFGIAREIQETMTRVTGKLSSGTLLYMSPEQLNGEAPKPSQDIYSFAAMVYECLKGEPPFSRGNIEFQIMNKQPEPLTDASTTGSLPVGVNGRDARSPSVAASVMSGLAKKPEDRPKTCAAVLEGNVSRGGAETRRNEYGNGRARTPAAPVGKEFSRGGAETQRTNGAGKVLAVLAFVAAIAVGWLYVNARAARSTGGTYPPRPKAEVALASSMRGGVPPVARKETTGGTYPPRPKAEVALASSMRGGVPPVARQETTGGTGVPPVIFDAGHEGVQRRDSEPAHIAVANQTPTVIVDLPPEKPQPPVVTNAPAAGEDLTRLAELRKNIYWKKRAVEQRKGELKKYREDADGLSGKIDEADRLCRKISKADAAPTVSATETIFSELRDDADMFDKTLVWLADNKALRDDARKLAGGLAELDGDLGRFKAKDLAYEPYAKGMENRKSGKSAFESGDFEKAKESYSEAKKLLSQAVAESRNALVSAALAGARKHLRDKRWEECIGKCDEALGWDAANAEARKLKADAKSQFDLAAKEAEKAKQDEAREKIENNRVIFDAGHEGVQLWEGGPYWATTNIGAEKPEDYGLYFWWGDTTGHRPSGTKFDFDFSSDNPTIYTCRKSISELKSAGWLTGSGVLAPEHDAAHVHWGGNWRIPTMQELGDLNRKCDWTWTTNGVNGYNVRGKGAYASECIFLPCAGYADGTSLGNVGSLGNAGSNGHYWSSVPRSNYSHAWHLTFYSRNHFAYGCYYDNGQPVRPVQGFAK